MFPHSTTWIAIFGLAAVLGSRGSAEEVALRQLTTTTNESAATLRVFADQKSGSPISPYITGKFAEHLGQNIYNGMFAQVLRNPTLAAFPFATGEMNPDGDALFKSDRSSIRQSLQQSATHAGWPREELDNLVTAYEDGLAAFWIREGAGGDVRVSPDTGEFGGRAQRVEVKAAGQGIAQPTCLPLFRTHRYTYEIMARSPDLTELTVALTPGGGQPGVSATVPGVTTQWQKFTGTLELAASVPAEAVVRFALTARQPGQFVVQHIFLQPADNLQGSDPDIIRFLKEEHLPLLRWPGGNFVSSYHWRDGVGPVERRPTKPNHAWGGIEPNLFGTDEFMEFCRAVGCEPMICVNGGDGTPAEAAEWIEYCNGPADSPMGKLRAANGHPLPYGVKYWEVGNELWGRWQNNWTTPAGYLDRYRQFAPVMLKADASIKLLGCGIPVIWGRDWNETLIAGAAGQLRSITDHPLVGGDVSADTDPLDVYRDFMAVPEVLGAKWAASRELMLKAGIQEPHLGITELQMYAHVARGSGAGADAKLTPGNLPCQPTITEAVYETLIYHTAARLGSFVELITQSAVVNHGAGLRKEHERVYAEPEYYAQAEFAQFANATPVAVEISSAMLQAPRVISDLKQHVPEASYSAVDALAAIATNGDLLISMVNRNTRPVHLKTELEGYPGVKTADEWSLSAEVPWAANSLNAPEAVKPVTTTATVQDGKLELELKPFGIVQLRLPRERF